MRTILAVTILAISLAPACARPLTAAEQAEVKAEMNIVLDSAVKGCRERFGSYHPQDTNQCISYISQRWYSDFKRKHPNLDIN